MRLEVRCCCKPQNLLGWIHDIPAVSQNLMVVFGDGTRATLEMALYHPAEGDRAYVAIKSNEIPIERWRTLNGFEENTR